MRNGEGLVRSAVVYKEHHRFGMPANTEECVRRRVPQMREWDYGYLQVYTRTQPCQEMFCPIHNYTQMKRS